MNGLDEVELQKLEDAVAAARKVIWGGGEGTGPISMLVSAAVASDERRIAELEQNSTGSYSGRERKEAEKTQSLIIGYLAQKEAALSAAEQAQYGEFLSKPFFTREDFEKLDQFYGSAYERLTERGKAEMSVRVWEGIRNDEYLFTNLPDKVREKESERLLSLLSNPEQIPENLKSIPKKDRDDFVAAMNSGEMEKAHEILNRDGFRENVATSVEGAMRKDQQENQTEIELDQTSAETEIPLLGKAQPTKPQELSF